MDKKTEKNIGRSIKATRKQIKNIDTEQQAQELKEAISKFQAKLHTMHVHDATQYATLRNTLRSIRINYCNRPRIYAACAYYYAYAYACVWSAVRRAYVRTIAYYPVPGGQPLPAHGRWSSAVPNDDRGDAWDLSSEPQL